MDYVYIGDIVNTHGIKGELRIISDFKYKNQVFTPHFNIYIGKNKKEFTIDSYRVHKNFDMVCLNGLNDINDALMYKGESVYVKRSDLNIDTYLDEELIGMSVLDEDKILGHVKELLKSKAYNLLVVTDGKKDYLVPNIKEFILNVDLDKKQITINNIKGLFDED